MPESDRRRPLCGRVACHRGCPSAHARSNPKGVAVTETADDAAKIATIRAHAREINGFVREGMPAMMRGMMR